jgi:hypothetical protein
METKAAGEGKRSGIIAEVENLEKGAGDSSESQGRAFEPLDTAASEPLAYRAEPDLTVKLQYNVCSSCAIARMPGCVRLPECLVVLQFRSGERGGTACCAKSSGARGHSVAACCMDMWNCCLLCLSFRIEHALWLLVVLQLEAHTAGGC